MATEKNLKKLTIHKLKKKTYNALAEKPVDELVMLTDVGGQVAEITEASADYVGEIVQYVGETNDTYTNGYFYKCVETDGVYSWTQVNVQEGGGGGASLPDQTDNAGKFLMTNGAETSWGSAIKNGGDSVTGTYNFGGSSGMKMTVKEGFGGGIQFFSAQYNQKGPEILPTTLGMGVNGVLYNVDGIYAKTTITSGKLNIPTEGGTLARIEDINNIVEVLPTADNGYTTVKNFGNNYIEASGIYEVGALEANAELVDVIPLPEGVQFEEGQMYWANAHATTEDSNGNAVVANIISRGSSDITIAYKNLGSTNVENLISCWEVRGMLATA